MSADAGLVRTDDSAGDPDQGTMRFATLDGVTVEIWRSMIAPGLLVVKVSGDSRRPVYKHDDTVAACLSFAADICRQWRGDSAAGASSPPVPPVAA